MRGSFWLTRERDFIVGEDMPLAKVCIISAKQRKVNVGMSVSKEVKCSNWDIGTCISWRWFPLRGPLADMYLSSMTSNGLKQQSKKSSDVPLPPASRDYVVLASSVKLQASSVKRLILVSVRFTQSIKQLLKLRGLHIGECKDVLVYSWKAPL